MLGELDGRRIRATGIARGIRQCLALRARCFGQLAPAVTRQHVPQPGEPVDELVPIRVP